MIVVFIALLASSVADSRTTAARDCVAHRREVESAVNQTRLSDRSVNAFEAVARNRMLRKLDVLPGILACPSISFAAKEVSLDPVSKILLRKMAITATDYISIGWTIVMAVDEEPIKTSNINQTLLRSNRRITSKHILTLSGLLKNQ